MGKHVGFVAAVLIAVAAAVLAPAFSQAANEVNFQALQYGAYVETVVGYFGLLAAVIALFILGAVIARY